MPNDLDVQVYIDGARHTQVDINIVLNEKSGIEATVIMDPTSSTTKEFRVDHINYVLSAGLEVDLWWEGEPHKMIRHLEGRGMVDRHIQNTAEKKTGRILLSAEGWKEGKPLRGSITVEAIKL